MSEIVLLRGQRHEVHECITCGVVYTCPETVIQHQRQSGGYHTCSNGHSQGWDKDGSENARLRRERDRLAQQIAQKDDEISSWRATAESQRKQAEKLRKRAAAGVCPCCNRSFVALSRHMKSKHPDFADKPRLKVVA